MSLARAHERPPIPGLDPSARGAWSRLPARLQFWITSFALVAAPLPFGSADLFWIVVWALVLAVAGALCIPLQPNREQQKYFWFVLSGCGIYGLIALAQVMPDVPILPKNPIWKTASDLLGQSLPERVSARASIPAVSVGHLLLFALGFVNGFRLGMKGRESYALFRAAAYSGLAYAGLGLIMNLLEPATLLWRDKTAYLGNVTGTFVNRNTAATYFGCCVILWLGLLWERFRALELVSARVAFFAPISRKRLRALLVAGGGVLVCLAALIGTGSRAGSILTFVALLTTSLLLAQKRPGERTVKLTLFGLGGALVLTAVMTGQVVGRIGSEGLFEAYRWSVYKSSLSLIAEYPWLGTGLGTFAEVFPSVRRDDISVWGVWDKAHSTLLEIAVEMGLPMAGLVLCLVFMCLRGVLRAASSARSERRALLASATGIAVISLSHALVDFSLQIPGFLIFFAVLSGCALARAHAPPSQFSESRASAPAGKGILAGSR